MTDPGKVLRVGLASPVHTLDPRKIQEMVGALVARQIFEAPYVLAEDQTSAEGGVLENLLEREPSPDDQPVYTAQVHPGILFSDGVPLEASHVAASLRATKILQQRCEVTADGDRVRFTLSRPNARFELSLTQSYCGICREENGRIFGSGPYALASEPGDEMLRLVRNPHYREPAFFEEIHFKVYRTGRQDNESLIDALEAGEVDFTTAITRKEAERLRGVRTLIEPGNSTAFLTFNTETVPDPTVRRALALAINRQEITALFYSNALTFTASSMLPRVMGASDDGLGYDPQQSLMLFGKPGVERPPVLRLLVTWSPRIYLPHPRAAAERIVKYLERVGVAVEMVVPENSDDYYERVSHGDYDMVLSGWMADTPDPAEFLEANLSSRLIPAPDRGPVSSTNESRWRNDAVDEALDRLRKDSGMLHKMKILNVVAQEVPLFPLMYGPTIYVQSRRLAKFRPPTFGVPSLAKMTLA